MFWKRIVVDKYIPFSHVGNSHVEIDFVKPATAILGSNGCGKSSLLRLLSVYPPERPSFLKDGKVVKVIEHRGHEFELTSDFSNSTAPHSFKKDGEELNLSGTTDTQKDLIEEHLDINPVINSIMSGDVHICDMQKSLRKQLFSATYPSDLSFVLEYHKKVCSKIREFSNQIKLLQGREGSLVASLITETERCYMEDYQEGYNEIINRIDKANLLLENECRQLESNPILKKSFIPVELDTARIDLDKYLQTYRDLLVDYNSSRKYGTDLSKESLQERFTIYDQKRQYLTEKKSELSKHLESVQNELNKFIRLRNAPKSDRKDELQTELELIRRDMNMLKESPDWKDSPDIRKDKIENVQQLIPEISRLLSVIHPMTGQLLSSEKITQLNNENSNLTFSNVSLNQEKVGIEQQILQHKSRREMMTQDSYPSDCSRVCRLRASLEASIRDIDMTIVELSARLDSINRQITQNSTLIDQNKSILQGISPSLPTMEKLWSILSENYLVELALNGETFLDCLNHHCMEINNRLVKGLKSSTVFYRYTELSNKAEAITSTLSMMETNESVSLSAEVIEDLIKDKQSDLDAGIEELDSIEKKCKIIEKNVIDVLGLKSLVENIEGAIGKIQDCLNIKILNNRIDFDKQIISEHIRMRNEVSAKLREIEHTLNNQKRINDILETEIKPTLEQLRKEKEEWESVETGLSPTKGLPCIYLVRFINRLISRANAFIKEIWYCDMELAYVEEKDNLDFTIGLILNKSTTVKDISLCSNGQKAIIDLAMTFAIGIERGFFNSFPAKLDECDAALTESHRAHLVDSISRLIETGVIKQLFLVNHFAIQTGLSSCDTVVLDSDGVVLPSEVYNEHVVIE